MMLDMFNLLRPPEPPVSTDPKEQALYLGRLHRYHFVVTSVVMALVVTSVWAVSPFGFARITIVDSMVAQQLQPMKAKQIEVEGVIRRMDDLQQRDSRRLALSLSNTLASDMRLLQARRCKETKLEEKDRYQREIDNKQNEFYELRQSNYQLQGCKDL